ncbi:MAG: DUF418 domain-containing protein [Sphingomicrobium sp.]
MSPADAGSSRGRFAAAWLSRFSMGPFEWIWRTLTYGQPPGLKAASPSLA